MKKDQRWCSQFVSLQLKLILIALIFSFFGGAAQASEKESLIFDKMKSLNAMRESLSATILKGTPVSEETFKAVCKPVGVELMSWSAKNGFKAKQVSHKNRNEMNAVPVNLSQDYKLFQKNNNLVKKVVKIQMDDGAYNAFLFRIPVVESCLSCHGAKADRPEFIKTKYPNDLAYNFKVGDLRGVYAIFQKANNVPP